jgi:hypothetical protein
MRKTATYAAALIGATALTAGTAYAQVPDLCVDGSRQSAVNVANTGQFVESPRAHIDGSASSVQITLRYSALYQCAWALREGAGDVWIEHEYPGGSIDRSSFWSGGNDTVTHSPAARIPIGQVSRACGTAQNGTKSSGWDAQAGGNIESPNASAGYDSSHETSRTAPECTPWM